MVRSCFGKEAAHGGGGAFNRILEKWAGGESLLNRLGRLSGIVNLA